VIQAARREGATVTLHNIRQQNTFVFPTGPRSLFSQNNYSYAQIRFTSCPPLEAHTNIYVSGRSQVRHECDVAVVDKSEADTCRAGAVHPRSSKILIAIECKFYAATLALDEARGFLGLTEEMRHTDRFLATNANSGDVGKMLAKHRRGWATGLVPANAQVMNVLRARFEGVFKDFKARHQ
jgi:hypothetical protein